jgi:phosphoribosylformimino-5-aminoimidazole carboxamide ribotide isomerase
MTVYDPKPLNTVRRFESCGATHLHLVDLEGARSGETTNLPAIETIARHTALFLEVGGGIRSMDTIERYLSAGANRVILGTAAVTNPEFLREALETYGGKIAVGVDCKDGKVAIRGWTEQSAYDYADFCLQLQRLGVETVICTDISKDGLLGGANHGLYRDLTGRFSMDIIASGGVSSLGDIAALQQAGVHGAIVGKAYYEGQLDLAKAIALAKEGAAL